MAAKKKGSSTATAAAGGGKSLDGLSGLVLATAYHGFAFWMAVRYLTWSQWVFREDASFGGQFKFLTQLNHIAQTVFFGLSIFNDLHLLFAAKSYAPKIGQRSALQVLVDHVFVILFGVATMVGLLFWSIFFYDRELILPAHLENLYPRELNLFQHGWTAVLMWIEGILFVNHHYHSVTKQIPNLLFVTMTYGLWTMCLKKRNGTWPYPFQEQLDSISHVLFYVVVVPIAIFVLFLGRVACELRWGGRAAGQKKPSTTQEPKKKKKKTQQQPQKQQQQQPAPKKKAQQPQQQELKEKKPQQQQQQQQKVTQRKKAGNKGKN